MSYQALAQESVPSRKEKELLYPDPRLADLSSTSAAGTGHLFSLTSISVPQSKTELALNLIFMYI